MQVIGQSFEIFNPSIWSKQIKLVTLHQYWKENIILGKKDLYIVFLLNRQLFWVETFIYYHFQKIHMKNTNDQRSLVI